MAVLFLPLAVVVLDIYNLHLPFNSLNHLHVVGSLNTLDRSSRLVRTEAPDTHTVPKEFIKLFQTAALGLGQQENRPNKSQDANRAVDKPDTALKVSVAFILDVGANKGHNNRCTETEKGTDGDSFLSEVKCRDLSSDNPDAVELVKGLENKK